MTDSDLITIEVIDVISIVDAEEKFVLVVEFFTNIYYRFYLVKLPILDYRMEKRLKHYKNIIN